MAEADGRRLDGRAALYALGAIVEGLRDAGVLTERAVEAIERRTQMGLDLAGAIDFQSAGYEPGESEAIRHGMWCAREFASPSLGGLDEIVKGHPDLPNWLSLEERRERAARGFED